jgi:hypothetical protein
MFGKPGIKSFLHLIKSTHEKPKANITRNIEGLNTLPLRLETGQEWPSS